MSTGLIVAIAVVALLALAFGLTYNRMVARRNAVDSSWAQIDVQLRKRHDLIPPLVEAVKGYAAHERGTFESVARSRSEAMSASGIAGRATAEGALGRATGALLGVAEAYPEL